MAAGTDKQPHNRLEMLKAFDETQAGVKGLIDSGISKVPQIFLRPSQELAQESTIEKTRIQIPTIDLNDFHIGHKRKQIVEQVKTASETFGFFQVVNHGIPQTVLDGMIDGVREFHEMSADEKKKYYTRDKMRGVRYNSSYDLFTSSTASWRDTLAIYFNSVSNSLVHEELPPVCRQSTVEFSKHVQVLGTNLFGLLSEALGLETDHLKNMECSQGHLLGCHYYPACPQPELAIGITKHSDAGFLTILLQNQTVGGLQVLYQGQWIDIQPTQGNLIVNIGDLLQLVSNGKFKSNEHRAQVNRIGPRISVTSFFTGPPNRAKIYGPINELISEESPPIYREIVLGEYVVKFASSGLDNYRALDYYKS